MKVKNVKRICGWVIVTLYFLIPTFNHSLELKYWGVWNLPFAVAIWELLVREWFLGISLIKKEGREDIST